jgi:hypothetical protein
VTGVDDLANAQVEVTLYRGATHCSTMAPQESGARQLAAHRHALGCSLIQRLHGSIKDGVLTTEPGSSIPGPPSPCDR